MTASFDVSRSPAAEPWSADALCAQTDPEAFFPEKGTSRPAKRVCTACPVEVECLEYALLNDERFGIWGNTSAKERRRIRTRLGLTPIPDLDDDPDEDEGPVPA